MKKEELRLGNYVLCHTENGDKIGKINHISGEVNSLVFSVATIIDGNDYIGRCDNITPIELTEQMLLDNGFVLNENGLFKGKDDINILRSGDGWEGVIFNKTSHCDFYRDKIYLHELQNLYYEVNKKELDFKL